MILSDISITRPVLASVVSIILVVFGLISFYQLPLREYPDIDPPVVSIETLYPGASANIVETKITELIEERVSGVEGIKFIQSSSVDGKSSINIEFEIDRDVDSAANDIRDRVSKIVDDLPEEAFPPEVQKVDSNEDVIMWLNLTGKGMSVPELTDYARRYLVDRFSVLNGVARVRVGGGQTYAIRIWLDRKELAARNLSVQQIENALRAENIELPAGSIESKKMQFTVRVERIFKKIEDFQNLVIAKGDDGYLIRLGEVARVEKGTEENRTFFRGNKVPMVGIGITKQSTANTIDVARLAIKEKNIINESLPEGMKIEESYDSSVFIENSINEVYKTLAIAIVLVIVVIYLFLGSLRATLVPAICVPVSLVATFIVLLMLGFSINLLTLLALVLAIGLVVDDAIVVLENIHRRIQRKGEPPLLAAVKGSRQVAFAVISTTLVLISVFTPISFLSGDIGRLFSEFAFTIIASVAFSSFVALSLSPMVASKILVRKENKNRILRFMDSSIDAVIAKYEKILNYIMRHKVIVIICFLISLFLSLMLFNKIPSEYAPKEDRGTFFVIINGPEGASFQYMEEYMNEIEKRLMPYVENNEISRLLVRAPRTFDNYSSFNSGIVIAVLKDWSERRNAFTIMDEVRGKLKDLPGVRAFPIMRQGFGASIQKPFQFVIAGGTFEKLAEWRNILAKKVEENNPGYEGLDWDYKETKPQLEININYDRAAELGVTIGNIGRTLETMLGSRRVTTYIEDGEEYDVILEGERESQRSATNLENIYVISSRTNKLIPLSNLVTLKEYADSNSLNRYNRSRAITLEANLKEGFSLGDAIKYMENLVKENLPSEVIIDYKGQSQDYKSSGDSIAFIFILGIIVTFLVLAAQFESYIHPFVIILTVPLAVGGGLYGLYITGGTLNIYSQIGLIMLVGLAAKNGILIVEFANQLRDEGVEFSRSIIEASVLRFRPIVMTGLTTAAGAVPLILSYGAGAETRSVIGITIFFGVIAATLFTLFVIPVTYSLFCKNTKTINHVKDKLKEQGLDL